VRVPEVEASGVGARVRRWLAGASPVVFSAWAIVAAFSTYFSMYAYRKPFAVGTFEGSVAVPFGLPEVDYKIALVIAQVLGYCLSKFVGIKVISELTPERRAVGLLGAIGASWAALVLFAVLPAPWAMIGLFLNGIPLGFVWGLTFGFLEGRRTSEALGAGLSASYILASGAVKSVGRWLLDAGVPEPWMPAAVGLLFAPGMLVFVWMLTVMPPPSAEDEASRTKRAPMDAAARRAFFMQYAPGLVPLIALYVLLTAYRDFRDNFAREIWDALGYSGSPEVFALSEVPVAIAVLAVLAALMAIRDNRTALLAVHGVMLSGVLLVGGATALSTMGVLDPAWSMVLVGMGLYMAYVPYGCVLFDRLIAAVGVTANAGFLIYFADAFGYLGSVLLLLYRNFGQANLSWLEFFHGASYATAIICAACFVFSAAWFSRRLARATPAG
jgi:hypothetical protein